MGLLSKGTPLDWPEAKKLTAYVKEHGIVQFLNIYRTCKDRETNMFLWGDEVESYIVIVNRSGDSKSIRLCLRGAEVITQLQQISEAIIARDEQARFHANFLPEYGCFMVEATPGHPYGNTTGDLQLVEANMSLRRRMIESLLRDEERLMTLGNYPLMGVEHFTSPPHDPNGPVAQSAYVPDQLISPHPRFATLTANIRQRRGQKVDIRVPFLRPDVNDDEKIMESDNTIHMDAMAFGMGCCCLQVTFQARNISEARHLNDHLAVLAPIMMALTAATPFYRGMVSDIDARWTVISQSVDDRNAVERGEEEPPADGSYQRLAKSRYDSISSYIAMSPMFKEEYNDVELEIHQPCYERLIAEGVDDLLARHVAHLFIRDPLVIYGEHVQLDDANSSDHFENIQSTNWQTVRFKPPPPNSEMGWRVEFRSMEVQVTDFENAAFTVFIALVSRAILMFDLNLYIPISKVDENMVRGHARDAIHRQKFYFRKNIKPYDPENEPVDCDAYAEYSMAEIICGKESDEFPGLVNIVRTYLETIGADDETTKLMDEYLTLIERRACGELLTAAMFMRRFVSNHPDYNHDGHLNEEVVHDLVETCTGIQNGSIDAPQLLGNVKLLQRPYLVHDEQKLADGPTPRALLRGSSYRLELPKGGPGMPIPTMMKKLLEKHLPTQPARLPPT